MIGIELNDRALTAVGEPGVLFSEPGYAIESEGKPLFGYAAERLARLYPERTQNRFWRDLNEVPLRVPVGPLKNSVDLAHAHLKRLWAACRRHGDDGVVFAVPGNWPAEQLGRLLGIAEEIDMPVHALVDRAAAATRSAYRHASLLYIDVSLHDFSVTVLDQDGQVSVATRHVHEALGAERLRRVCAEHIAARFVESTRFDPLHDAVPEQYLYNQLDAWLPQLARDGSLAAAISFDKHQFEATIDLAGLQSRLAATLEPVIQKLRSLLPPGKRSAIQCSSALARLPGMAAILGRLPDAQVFALEPAAAAWGALQRSGSLPASRGGYRLVTSMPWDAPPVELDAPGHGILASAQRDTRPTHLLYKSRAYDLSSGQLHIGAELAPGDYGIQLDAGTQGVSRRHCSIQTEGQRLVITDHSRFGTRLNGHAINGSAILHSGDVVVIGTPPREFQLIAEVKADGPPSL